MLYSLRDCPHLVKVFGVFEAEGRKYLVQEWAGTSCSSTWLDLVQNPATKGKSLADSCWHLHQVF
jgi:hypothetical protein